MLDDLAHKQASFDLQETLNVIKGTKQIPYSRL